MATAKKQWINGIPNDAVLIGGAALTAGAAYLVVKQINKKKALNTEDTAASLPAASTPTGGTGTTTTLNKNLVLKNGSKGNEVKELQKRMGITADGIFGNQTQAKLLALKLVTQISLSQYDSTPTVNQNALAVGTRIMANRKPNVVVNKAVLLANQKWDLQDVQVSQIPFGTEAGTIYMLSQYKTKYIVRKSGTNIVIGWVLASDVVKL